MLNRILFIKAKYLLTNITTLKISLDLANCKTFKRKAIYTISKIFFINGIRTHKKLILRTVRLYHKIISANNYSTFIN